MALGITLSPGYPADPIPWLYPLYSLVPRVPRQIADDHRCAAKDGALWQDHCRKVPHRIVPWLD